MLFVKDVFKGLLAYYPAVVPTLFIFYLESSTSLKFWKASQILAHRELPDVSKTEETPQENPTSLSLPKRIGLALCMVFVVAIIFVLDETQRKIFFLCTLFVPFMTRVAATGGMLYGTVKRFAFRTREGNIIFQLVFAEGVGYVTRRCFDVLGALVAAAALWYELPIAVSIVYASMLQSLALMTVNAPIKPTFRRHFWVVNGMVIFFLLSTALCILLPLIALERDPKEMKLSAFGIMLHLASEGDPKEMKSNNWFYIITSILYLMGSFSTLSLLLRFDHANSLPIGSPPPPDSTTVASNRLSCCEIPAFPRPYFKMGFSALAVVLIGIATMPAAGIPRFGLDTFGFFAAFGAAPVMVYGALVMAALKGQLRDLWKYDVELVFTGKGDVKADLEIGEKGHSDSPLKLALSNDIVAA